MARAIERLNQRGVKRISSTGYHADGQGLYLSVSSTGAKSWIFVFMLRGRQREMGLGSERVYSLADARGLASRARKLLAEGIDPIQARDAERAQQALKQASNKTFAVCVAEYIAAHRKEWKNAKHAGQWEMSLGESYCKSLLPLPIQGIEVGHVLETLKPIWDTTRETGVRLRGRIERVIDYATALGYRTGPNCARWRGNLDHLLAKDKRRERVEHHPSLPHTRVAEFVQKLRAEEGTAARALEFSVLVAARTKETIGAVWSQFDLDMGVWTIPKERMKSKRQHRVALAPAVIALLRALPRRGDFVFAGRSEKKTLSNMAMLELIRRWDPDGTNWIDPTDGRRIVPHGFRSSFRDWAAERTNFNGEIAEACLAHVNTDETEAAYLRSDFFQKRTRLMRAWAEYVDAVQPATTVTPIRKASA
jgi:integrase